jgi:hypothetical protein
VRPIGCAQYSIMLYLHHCIKLRAVRSSQGALKRLKSPFCCACSYREYKQHTPQAQEQKKQVFL